MKHTVLPCNASTTSNPAAARTGERGGAGAGVRRLTLGEVRGAAIIGR